MCMYEEVGCLMRVTCGLFGPCTLLDGTTALLGDHLLDCRHAVEPEDFQSDFLRE